MLQKRESLSASFVKGAGAMDNCCRFSGLPALVLPVALSFDKRGHPLLCWTRNSAPLLFVRTFGERLSPERSFRLNQQLAAQNAGFTAALIL
jgi:hypothetical protein